MEEQARYEIQKVDVQDFAMTAEGVLAQVHLIQEVMKKVMKEGEHFGTIPHTQKPTLYKPGAEKLSLTFRFSPTYQINQANLPNNHREYSVTCTLTHIPTGAVLGQGVGSCSTMESKYRYRKAEQKCPECGRETIIKGKKEYGGGWLCFQKKGGCGAKFKDGDSAIENQNMGRVEYSDPADYFNTVLKMAKKRAHVDAVLTATAASDIFTQDVEDLPMEEKGGESHDAGKTGMESQPTGNVTSPPPSGEKKKPGRPPAKKTAPDVPDLATQKQTNLLRAMIKEVEGFEPEHKTEFYLWLKRREGCSVSIDGKATWLKDAISKTFDDFDTLKAAFIEAKVKGAPPPDDPPEDSFEEENDII